MLSTIGEYWKQIIAFVIIMLIVGVVFGFWLMADGQTSRARDNILQTTNSLSNSEYARYNNQIITGAEVIEAAIKFRDKPQFSIRVVTGNNPAGFYMENISAAPNAVCYATPVSVETPVGTPANCTVASMTTVLQAQDTTSILYYINPTARFNANVYRDSNGEVRLLEFRQR